MAKFSNQFLSYYDAVPKGNAEKNMVFLPIWIWRIWAPIAGKKTDINVFQKTILEFLHIGHQDRQELAQWIGVDIELINLVIDTELVPRGLIQIDLKDKKITLTPKGVQTLDDEIERTEDLQAYYLVQDAITGELWHRLIPNELALLDVQENNSNIYIQGSRDSGKSINVFLVEPREIKEPQAPTPYKINQTIKNHNMALRGTLIRDDDPKGKYLDGQNLKNFEFYPQKPEAFFILSHLDESLDSSHVCQLQDPCHVSKYDEWIQSLHFDLATKHQGFAKKIKRYLKQDIDSDETIEEFETRLLEETSFELAVDFPFSERIENLSQHLNRLLTRKKNLEEKRNYFDIDDLLNQCQKALEACFKHMLCHWKHKHANTTPKQLTREQIKTVLVLQVGEYFCEDLLEKIKTVNSSHVFSANGYSAGRFPQVNVSLKPLIVSSLLCVTEYQQHPLILRKQHQQDLQQLIEICELRNQGSHDSGEEVDITTALNLSEFTLDWISFYTAIEA
ncbi:MULTISPECIES: hypothetical protein [Acinetobacter]|uniref:hypothetical protein n=1 Tax=Acinetobacter TaxID=469 RepID=UPI0015D0E709|nr:MULTISPECIES: hypothetical protein [Acinetobacter]MDA3433847.1 hypothetical protein [Acinetobacter baumannii]